MRLIDADALIEKLQDDAEHMVDGIFKLATHSAIKDIKDAPTVESERKENGWSSCSKKKPKVGVDVLIRFEHNCAVGFYSNGSWNINSGNGYYTGLTESEDQPVAWMPLPEPREGERE